MLERPTEAKSALLAEPGIAHALARAAAAVARVDQALTGHPLLPAFLYRTRLEAVRRQAAVMARRLIHGTSPRCSRASGCAWTTLCASSIAA